MRYSVKLTFPHSAALADVAVKLKEPHALARVGLRPLLNHLRRPVTRAVVDNNDLVLQGADARHPR